MIAMTTTTTPVATYGDSQADLYDRIYPETPDLPQAAAFVSARTPHSGRVLEFGVGTGRIALHLARCGLRVEGLDASAEMLDRLSAKAEQQKVQIPGHLGDFTDTRCPGVFDTVLIALNSLFMVPTQAGQMAALRNAAAHLTPSGRIIIEAYDPTRMHSLPTGSETMVQHPDETTTILSDMVVNRVAQMAFITQTVLSDGAVHKLQEVSRYAFPAELDLMAQVAGLALVERVEHWSERPYEFRSQGHVSVYRVGA